MQINQSSLERFQKRKECLRLLGGAVAPRIVATPDVVGGMIKVVLLGDKLPDGEPVVSVKGFERGMDEAGL